MTRLGLLICIGVRSAFRHCTQVFRGASSSWSFVQKIDALEELAKKNGLKANWSERPFLLLMISSPSPSKMSPHYHFCCAVAKSKNTAAAWKAKREFQQEVEELDTSLIIDSGCGRRGVTRRNTARVDYRVDESEDDSDASDFENGFGRRGKGGKGKRRASARVDYRDEESEDDESSASDS
eukprot:SAG31_NODE_5632_length_2412_cov_6.545179_2_plen_181_part_00